MSKKLDLRSISVQLIALIIIVAIVPALVLSYYSSTALTTEKNKEFQTKGQNIGHIGILSYQSVIDEDRINGQKIAGDASILMNLKAGDKAAMKRLVDDYASEYSLDIVSVTDKDGIMLARSSTDLSGDRTTNEYILSALAGKEVYGTDLLSSTTVQNNNLKDRVKETETGEALAIIDAVPVYDEKENLLGAVFIAHVQNENSLLVDSVAASSDGFCAIIQGDIRVANSVKDTNGNRLVGSKIDSAVASRVLNKGETVSDVFTIEGQTLFVNYMPLKDINGKTIGVIAVGYDVGQDMATMNNMTMTSLGVGVVMAILAVIVGLVVVTRIVKPINTLVIIANSVADGNLDTVVATGATGGEIGELTGAVRKMVANIKERIAFNESILKSINDPMSVYDKERNITYMNDVAAKAIGVDPKAVIGKKCYDVYNSPACKTGCAVLECWKRNEPVSNFETTVRGADGSQVWIRGNASPIYDNTGKIIGGMELFKDITLERAQNEKIKAAEKDSTDKAAFSDAILKSIGDMHGVLDVNGNLTYINYVALNTLGYRQDEAIGRKGDDVFGLEISVAQKMARENSQVLQMENVVTTRAGKKIPIAASVSAMKDADGNLAGFSGIFRDITKEKEAKKQLQEITVSANKIAEKVAGASNSVSSSIGQVQSSSRQISESITQIASGSQNQAKNIDEISSLMHDMNRSINQVTDGARQTSEDAVKANLEARKGSENAKVAMRKMSDLHMAVKESADIVQNLGEKSKKIGQIVDMITAIAGQTNLLALNAAIEAARAGEAGRGFAVVAEEVRKLAEDAAKAAEEINTLIGEVRDQTARAVESMNKGTTEVDASNKVVAESLKSLEDIGHLIDTTTAKAQEIAAMTAKQAEDTQRVVKAVEDMAAIIEESASSSEEVSASSEETTSIAEQVAGMAADLSRVAEELKIEVGKLKVE